MSPRTPQSETKSPVVTDRDSTLAAQDVVAPGRRVGGGFLDPKMLWTVAAGRVPQAGPPGPDQEPGHVRGRDRLGADRLRRDRPAVDLRLDDHRLAVADRALRQPGGGGRRGPRQGAGGDAAADQAGDGRAAADRVEARRFRRARSAWSRYPAPRSRSATTWSSRRARSSPATATSSTASPRSTSRPSPASRLRSSASPAATGRRSPAAPRCCRTRSSSRSPPSRVRRSSTG